MHPPSDYFADLPARLERLSATLPHEQATALRRYGCAPFASDPSATLTPQRGPDTLLLRGRLYVCRLKPYAIPGRAYPNGWEERAARPAYHRWYDSASASGNLVREAARLLQLTLRALNLVDVSPRDVSNTYAYPSSAPRIARG